MVAPPAARHGASVEQLLFDSKTYTVATNQEAERAGGGIKRAWNKTEISAQEASGEAEFSVHVGDFRGGYGHSYLHDNEPPDVYETAHQWDLSALGKATPWGPMATCESFTTSDERGWVIYQDPFFYILKGRYSVKYRLEDGHGATLSIVEFQDFAAPAKSTAPALADMEGQLRDYGSRLAESPDDMDAVLAELKHYHKIMRWADKELKESGISEKGWPTKMEMARGLTQRLVDTGPRRKKP